MKRDLILIGIFAVIMAAVNVFLVLTHRMPWMGRWDWQSFGTMVAAAVTVAVMTQLYKDNALFKLVEHMFVGTLLGYGLLVIWYQQWVNEIIDGFRKLATLKQGVWWALWNPMAAQQEANMKQLLGPWSLILPFIIGLLMYARLSKKYAWISRIPLALMIGFGVGFAIPAAVQAGLLKQLEPMMVDLLHDPVTGGFMIHWNEIIAFIGVIATLIYFFFSLEHKGVVGGISRVGVWFLMVSFGASFGYNVMGRLSLLIGRVDFLFREWIPLAP